jgi:hypothetical protein
MLRRWHDLFDEYHRCDGRTLYARLRVFQVSLFAFNGNLDSLLRAIETMRPNSVSSDETMFEFSDRIDLPLMETCRCLQNFVSSAMTLVDQSRVLYKELYEPKGQLADYEREVKHRFADDPIHQFVQGLRNMTVHKRLPVISYHENRHFQDGSIVLDVTVCLQKADLLQYDRWNGQARMFLENGAEKINVAQVMRDYHQTVAGFHDWFSRRQRETNAAELEYRDSLERELRQLDAEIRNQHRARWSNIDPYTG